MPLLLQTITSVQMFVKVFIYVGRFLLSSMCFLEAGKIEQEASQAANYQPTLKKKKKERDQTTTNNPVGPTVGQQTTRTGYLAVSQSDSHSTYKSITHSANPSVSQQASRPATHPAGQSTWQHGYQLFNLLPQSFQSELQITSQSPSSTRQTG